MAGVVSKELMIALAAVLLGVALILFLGDVKDTAEYVVDSTSCRASLEVYAKQLSLGIPADTATIDCPPFTVEVTGDNDNKKIAQGLKTCSDRFSGLQLSEEKGIFCAVCAFVEADEERQVIGLTSYMESTLIPGERDTYLHTLMGGTDYQALLEQNTFSDFGVSPQQPHAIFYINVRDLDAFNYYWEQAKTISDSDSLFLGLLLTSHRKAALFVKTFSFVADYLHEATFLEYSELLLRPYSKTTLEELGCTDVPIKV